MTLVSRGRERGQNYEYCSSLGRGCTFILRNIGKVRPQFNAHAKWYQSRQVPWDKEAETAWLLSALWKVSSTRLCLLLMSWLYASLPWYIFSLRLSTSIIMPQAVFWPCYGFISLDILILMMLFFSLCLCPCLKFRDFFFLMQVWCCQSSWESVALFWENCYKIATIFGLTTVKKKKRKQEYKWSKLKDPIALVQVSAKAELWNAVSLWGGGGLQSGSANVVARSELCGSEGCVLWGAFGRLLRGQRPWSHLPCVTGNCHGGRGWRHTGRVKTLSSSLLGCEHSCPLRWPDTKQDRRSAREWQERAKGDWDYFKAIPDTCKRPHNGFMMYESMVVWAAMEFIILSTNVLPHPWVLGSSTSIMAFFLALSANFITWDSKCNMILYFSQALSVSHYASDFFLQWLAFFITPAAASNELM